MARKSRLSNNDPFATSSEGTKSIRETDEQLFGAIQKVDAGRMVAHPISIFSIDPDKTQPRRAVPSAVRALWDEQPNTLPALFQEWLRLIEQESGQPFDVQTYLVTQDDFELNPQPGLIEAAFQKVAELANSIRRDGLVNPITVIQNGIRYTIETGERRWLAYHLLHAYTQDDQWARISAQKVDSVDRFRQAAENAQRDNLNAIGKARQFAVLLMEIYQQKGAEFLPYSAFEHEREFYAQVADGDQWRIPRGTSAALLSGTGMKHPDQLSHIRALLSLPDAVWQIADDLDWAEGKLRPLSRLHDPDQIIAATCALLRQEGYKPTIFGICDSVDDKGPPTANRLQQLMTRLDQVENDYLKKTKNLNRSEKRELINRIATHQRAMDEIRKLLEDDL